MRARRSPVPLPSVLLRLAVGGLLCTTVVSALAANVTDEGSSGPASSPALMEAVARPAAGAWNQRGLASHYGNEFNGRRTASGAAFNPQAFTAAHRSLPFGTRVRVKNLHNGRSVVVKINDRGPWTAGRVIDLSQAAAQAIGLRGLGTVAIDLAHRDDARSER